MLTDADLDALLTAHADGRERTHTVDATCARWHGHAGCAVGHLVAEVRRLGAALRAMNGAGETELRPDDEPGTLDEVVARGGTVHLEVMSDECVWVGLPGDKAVHVVAVPGCRLVVVDQERTTNPACLDTPENDHLCELADAEFVSGRPFPLCPACRGSGRQGAADANREGHGC